MIQDPNSSLPFRKAASRRPRFQPRRTVKPKTQGEEGGFYKIERESALLLPSQHHQNATQNTFHSSVPQSKILVNALPPSLNQAPGIYLVSHVTVCLRKLSRAIRLHQTHNAGEQELVGLFAVSSQSRFVKMPRRRNAPIESQITPRSTAIGDEKRRRPTL